MARAVNKKTQTEYEKAAKDLETPIPPMEGEQAKRHKKVMDEHNERNEAKAQEAKAQDAELQKESENIKQEKEMKTKAKAVKKAKAPVGEKKKGVGRGRALEWKKIKAIVKADAVKMQAESARKKCFDVVRAAGSMEAKEYFAKCKAKGVDEKLAHGCAAKLAIKKYVELA